jgi:hypothetical protein
MIFVGDDWAEDHHDVYLMDEAGTRLAARRLPEGMTGPPPLFMSSLSSTIRSPSSRPRWRRTRTPTSTAPCQDLVLCSAPGCSVSSGTTRTATPAPSLARTAPEPHP